MNGRLDILPDEEIHLRRGPAGLGFNIVGGTNQQYITNDSGIYVSRIKEGGAAADNGRLQEGDKILSINGRELNDLLHSEAVEIFREAGEDVILKVQHKSQVQNGPSSIFGDDSDNTSMVMILIPTSIAVVSLVVWAYLRYRQRM